MTIWDRIKWLGLAILAAIGSALAFLYGRKTIQVTRAKVRAAQAKERILSQEIDMARHRAQQTASYRLAAEHMERAKTLEAKLDKVRERLRTPSQIIFLDDVQLASRDNARLRDRQPAR